MSEKAWSVMDYQRSGYGVVVFAETRGKARVAGCSNFEFSEFTELEVRRAPAFDGLNADALTPRAYIERGWWQRCRASYCEQQCDEERAFYDEDGAVFCSEECREAHRCKS